MKRFLFVVGGILLGILASNLLDMLMKHTAGACIACANTHDDTNDEPQRASIPQVRVGHAYERLLDADKIDLLRWTVGTTMWWPAALIDFLLDEIANGKDISSRDYPQSAADVEQALRMVRVKDKRVLVAGSTTPWVEAIALYLGASEVVAAGHRAPVCRECHPRLRTMEMNKALRVATPADYDIIVSYSSIEHDGLGGYGEPLDPDGDMHAMNELRTLLHPSGVLLVAVPCGADDVIDVKQYSRIYSGKRLPLLLRGWDYGGNVHQTVWSPNVSLSPVNDRAWKPILILRPATPPSNCTLNCASAIGEHDYTCIPANDCALTK
jgi:hypothetical protein